MDAYSDGIYATQFVSDIYFSKLNIKNKILNIFRKYTHWAKFHASNITCHSNRLFLCLNATIHLELYLQIPLHWSLFSPDSQKRDVVALTYNRNGKAINFFFFSFKVSQHLRSLGPAAFLNVLHSTIFSHVTTTKSFLIMGHKFLNVFIHVNCLFTAQ